MHSPQIFWLGIVMGTARSAKKRCRRRWKTGTTKQIALSLQRATLAALAVLHCLPLLPLPPRRIQGHRQAQTAQQGPVPPSRQASASLQSCQLSSSRFPPMHCDTLDAPVSAWPHSTLQNLRNLLFLTSWHYQRLALSLLFDPKRQLRSDLPWTLIRLYLGLKHRLKSAWKLSHVPSAWWSPADCLRRPGLWLDKPR